MKLLGPIYIEDNLFTFQYSYENRSWKYKNIFFVLNFGNTEKQSRNEVLTITINKKQFAELPLCLKKSEIKNKTFILSILLKKTRHEAINCLAQCHAGFV